MESFTEAARLKIERSDWVVYLLAIAFSVVGVIDGNYAMMVGCIGIPFALIWISKMLRDKKRRTWALRALAYGSAMALLIGGPTSCEIHTRRTETKLQPVIEALELHKVRTGHYPKELTELSPPMEANCAGVFTRKANYHRSGDTFRLTCITFGMNHHTYKSENRRWEDWD